MGFEWGPDEVVETRTGMPAEVVRVDGSREAIALVADGPASYGAITVRPRDPILLRRGDRIAPKPNAVDLGDLGMYQFRFPPHVVLADVDPPNTYGFMIVMEGVGDD